MANGSLLQPEHLAPRRKLLENVMAGFVVGNTNARGIDPAYLRISPARDQINLLYLGVGDMRNPLTAIQNLDTKAKETIDLSHCKRLRVCLHLNDMNTIVLARNAVFLLVAANATCVGTSAQATAAAIAVWSDAYFLTGHIPTRLIAALTKLIDESDRQSLVLGGQPWLRAGCNQSFAAMHSHWVEWRTLLHQQIKEGACSDGNTSAGKTIQAICLRSLPPSMRPPLAHSLLSLSLDVSRLPHAVSSSSDLDAPSPHVLSLTRSSHPLTRAVQMLRCARDEAIQFAQGSKCNPH